MDDSRLIYKTFCLMRFALSFLRIFVFYCWRVLLLVWGVCLSDSIIFGKFRLV